LLVVAVVVGQLPLMVVMVVEEELLALLEQLILVEVVEQDILHLLMQLVEQVGQE
jgi:hypothetical protein